MLYGVEAQENLGGGVTAAEAGRIGFIDFINDTYFYVGDPDFFTTASYLFGVNNLIPNAGLFIRENYGTLYQMFTGTSAFADTLSVGNWTLMFEVDFSNEGGEVGGVLDLCQLITLQAPNAVSINNTYKTHAYADPFVSESTGPAMFDQNQQYSVVRTVHDPWSTGQSVRGIHRFAFTRTNDYIALSVDGDPITTASRDASVAIDPAPLTDIFIGSWEYLHDGVGGQKTYKRFFIRSMSLYAPKQDSFLPKLSALPAVLPLATFIASQIAPPFSRPNTFYPHTFAKRSPVTAVTTGVVSNVATVATVTPALPASLVTNNIMIAYVQVNAGSKTFAVGGGWTIGDTATDANSSTCWAWRYVDGTQAAPVFTWTGTANTTAQVQQFGQVASSSAIGNFGNASGTGTTLAVSAITTTRDVSAAIAILFAGTSQTIPLPATFTNIATNANANGSFRTARLNVGLSGGSSGAVSVTITSANWHGFLIELKGPP